MMIREYWKRISAWASGNAPKMLEDLNSGATDEELHALETELGVSLPDELRESLRVHNGESDGWPSKVFADYGAYLGTDQIAEAWKQRQEIAGELAQHQADMPDIEEQIRDGLVEVAGPVRPEMFLRQWIPVMDCNGDVFWAVDMAPAEGGKVGQIIEVDWEGCSWKVVADSFASFMGQYVSQLERGEFQIEEGLPTRAEFDRTF